MRRRYPNQEDATFLVCEQVRPEQGNKLSIIGWYAGDEIIFQVAPDKKPPFTLASLAFAVRLRGGAGVFKGKFFITAPNGNDIVSGNVDSNPLAKNGIHTFIFNFPLIQFSDLGQYKFRLRLGRQTYEFSFGVSVSRLEQRK